MTHEEAIERIAALLKNAGQLAKCRGCGADIYWVRHANGVRAPYTPEGLNHFADCPAAGTFRKEPNRG